MNQTYPTIHANTVPTGIVEKMSPDLAEPNPTIAIPDHRCAFPGYAITLPAVLDETIHLLGAESASLIRSDPARDDALVELGRASWTHWTGTRLRRHGILDSMLSIPGQIEVDHGSQLSLPFGLLEQSPGVQHVAFSPIAVRGYGMGALWIGRDRKLSSAEILMLESMADVLAEVIFCLSNEHQKEVEPFDAIRALIRLLAAWDIPTYQHSIRLVAWARTTARLLGCAETEIQLVSWAALLHDIGKVGVPKGILHKPGPLTDDEWRAIKLHPKIGAKLLEPVVKLHPLKDLILCHHEKLDGSGYPLGLRGLEIPLGARIIAVVDAYGAMTEERIYRPRFTHEQAIAEVRRCEGTHFDPQIGEAFIAQFERDRDYGL